MKQAILDDVHGDLAIVTRFAEHLSYVAQGLFASARCPWAGSIDDEPKPWGVMVGSDAGIVFEAMALAATEAASMCQAACFAVVDKRLRINEATRIAAAIERRGEKLKGKGLELEIRRVHDLAEVLRPHYQARVVAEGEGLGLCNLAVSMRRACFDYLSARWGQWVRMAGDIIANQTYEGRTHVDYEKSIAMQAAHVEQSWVRKTATSEAEARIVYLRFAEVREAGYYIDGDDREQFFIPPDEPAAEGEAQGDD